MVQRQARLDAAGGTGRTLVGCRPVGGFAPLAAAVADACAFLGMPRVRLDASVAPAWTDVPRSTNSKGDDADSADAGMSAMSADSSDGHSRLGGTSTDAMSWLASLDTLAIDTLAVAERSSCSRVAGPAVPSAATEVSSR